jgi:hypothetical protein
MNIYFFVYIYNVSTLQIDKKIWYTLMLNVYLHAKFICSP